MVERLMKETNCSRELIELWLNRMSHDYEKTKKILFYFNSFEVKEKEYENGLSDKTKSIKETIRNINANEFLSSGIKKIIVDLINYDQENNIKKVYPTIQEAWIDSGLARWNGDVSASLKNKLVFKAGHTSLKGDFTPPEVSDMDKLTSMRDMFWNCQSLTSLDLNNWDTSNATNMKNMFLNCINLKSLNLNSFNTSKVVNMIEMFNSCTNLTSLDLSNWDVSNVTNMSWMFYNCANLTSLNLSGWDVSNVKNMDYIFKYCKSLKEIKCSEATKNKILSFDFVSLPKDFNGWKVVC